jgi:hypothetical protein
MSVLLLQMAHAEDVEDLVGLDGALPEAAEVGSVPSSDAGEGTCNTLKFNFAKTRKVPQRF